MTRDYKRPRAKASRPTPGWVWLLVGFGMGLAVALLVYLNARQALEELAHGPQGAPERPRQERTQQAKPQPPAEPKRRFDFYTLLPELEVLVPEEPGPGPDRKRSAKPPPKTDAPAPRREGYVLQAGSFQRYQEADAFKARLALLGVEARIHTARVNRDTWHRVRIGPYADLAKVNRIRSRLRKNNVDTMLLRVRN
jgi:cell division protein FtsN